MTWLTGHEDLLPFEPYCVGDPNAGLHALVGLLLALEHRDRTGEGGLVEAAMVDAALNITAEQVIEHSAYGALLQRTGNRGPMAAPQNLYLSADEDHKGRRDTWVAIAVETDDQWAALGRALGDPAWATDPALATTAGRVAAHDAIDEHLAAWCDGADRRCDRRRSCGRPGSPSARSCSPTTSPTSTSSRPEGSSRRSTTPWPVGRGSAPSRSGSPGAPSSVHARPAPLLGEHNDELLGELGLTPEEIEQLEADGVIGRALVADR